MAEQIRMFDSVNVKMIPPNAQAVAGYVAGYWPTFAQLRLNFPTAHKLSIAINANEDAMALDVERGDATPDQAPYWVKRQIKRGVYRPVVYSAVSEMETVLCYLTIHGIKRAWYRIWTAHETGVAHVCSPACGYGAFHADATQWTFHSYGRNLDESLVQPWFFKPPVVKKLVYHVAPYRWLRYGRI